MITLPSVGLLSTQFHTLAGPAQLKASIVEHDELLSAGNWNYRSLKDCNAINESIFETEWKKRERKKTLIWSSGQWAFNGIKYS